MEKFEITKEQIFKIYDATSVNNQEEIKQWFPNSFLKELGVGKWAKSKNTNCLVFITEFTKRGFNGYGFNNENKFCDLKNDDWTSDVSLWTLATEQEVKTALINEAKKIGYHNNCTNRQASYVYDIDYNNMYFNGIKVFNKGKWAEIIQTITKEEAEKLLNKKII